MIRRLKYWLRLQTAAITRAPKKNAYCSFCRRSYKECAPLAEGPDLVFICGDCATTCRKIIDDETARLAAGRPRS